MKPSRTHYAIYGTQACPHLRKVNPRDAPGGVRLSFPFFLASLLILPVIGGCLTMTGGMIGHLISWPFEVDTGLRYNDQERARSKMYGALSAEFYTNHGARRIRFHSAQSA
ncbi:MAG: hypothetical protein KDK25_06930 [Leptospiraceae bacterium]|nr:hypothetical protein [Leptospiraceae bacterium]